MKVTVHIDENINIDEQIPEIQSNIISLSGTQLDAIVRKNSPSDTGHLRTSWVKKEEQDKVTLATSAKYAVYQNEGTGIYGKSGARILPKTKKVLRWTKKGEVFFAKSVAGVKGKHFVEKSVKELEKKIPSIAQQAVNKAIKK